MNLPDNKLPTRSEWRKLRDNVGGKKGLSTVEVGPGLDDFHEAYKKAAKSNDIGPLNQQITKLSKTIKTYISEVKKDHKKVADVATAKIQKELDLMTEALENAVKKETTGLNQEVAKLDLVLKKTHEHKESVIKDIDKFGKEIKQILLDFQKAPGTKAILLRAAENLRKDAMEFDNVASNMVSGFSSTLVKFSLPILKSREKEIADVKKVQGEIRNKTASNLKAINEVIAALSPKK